MSAQLPDTRQRTVVIIGMHRSGTSALAGAMANAGFSIGDRSTLFEGDAFNESGFYEQREAVEINESILLRNFVNQFPSVTDYGCNETPEDLSGLGWLFGAWLNLDKLSTGGVDGQHRIPEFLSRLHEHDPRCSQYIVKDPRLSLTFPIWSRHVVRPVIVMLLRNPASVAASLWHRNRLDPLLSHSLWLRYTHAALLNTTKHPAFIVDFDQLVESPLQSVRDILDWLDNQGFRISDEAYATAGHFVSPVLRHHRDTTEENIPGDIMTIYEEIKKSLPGNPGPDVLDYGKAGALCPWQTALYVLARQTTVNVRTTLQRAIEKLTQEMNMKLLRAESAHQRLVTHPIAGRVIRALSRLKRDPSFGQMHYHLAATDRLVKPPSGREGQQ